MKSICKKHSIELMVLFGSRAHGTGRPNSDMDVAVKAVKGSRTDRLGLILDLERIFHKSVDLVIVSPITDPLLLNEIFTNGEPVYQRNKGVFVRWRTFAWHCFLDTQWIRDRQWAWIKKNTAGAL
jgi:predicted nucleotidyltransferase